MSVTITHIAKTAGVSNPVVSKVLNGGRSNVGVSDVTRRRVEEIALQMGYRPNAAARATRQGRHRALGLLMGTNPGRTALSFDLFWGISEKATEHDVQVVSGQFPDAALEDRSQLPRIVRELAADGLIISYQSDVPERFLEAVGLGTVPCVWANFKLPHDAVCVDDFGGAADATRRLLQLGHTRIAYVSVGATTHYSQHDRAAGYTAAMREAGLTPVELRPDKAVPQRERAAMFREWLARSDRPTAVVTYSEGEALPLLYAAAQAGIDVPGELSIVAIHNAVVVAAGLPITTQRFSFYAMGHEAVEMLMQKTADPRRTLPTRNVPMTWIEGETVAVVPRPR